MSHVGRLALLFALFVPVVLAAQNPPVPDIQVRARVVAPEIPPGTPFLVTDCEQKPRCSDALHGRGGNLQVPLDDRLREAALRTGIAMLLGMGRKLDSIVVCVDETQPDVLASLRRYVRTLAPASECRMDPPGRVVPGMHLIHAPSGRFAHHVRAENLTLLSGGAEVDVSYYFALLDGKGWKCRLELKEEGWVARWCRMTWVL